MHGMICPRLPSDLLKPPKLAQDASKGHFRQYLCSRSLRSSTSVKFA